MGFNRPDVYNQPEVFGLELVGSIDWADSYEFDIIAVFYQPEDGQWFYGADAGCSCPSPFERFTGTGWLTPVMRHELAGVLEAKVEAETSRAYGNNRHTAVAALLERVWAWA